MSGIAKSDLLAIKTASKRVHLDRYFHSLVLTLSCDIGVVEKLLPIIEALVVGYVDPAHIVT